jgi:hypothetical protein
MLFSESEINALNCIFDKLLYNSDRSFTKKELEAMDVLHKAIKAIKHKKSIAATY